MNILETERLILRHLQPDDLESLYVLYCDPEIRRYFPDGTLTLEQTKEEIAWFQNGHPVYPHLGLWAAVHKHNGQFIGRCGLIPWTINGVQEVEVAYMFSKPYWRQGLGAEAATALVRYGLENLRLPRLIALIDPEHEASIRTAKRAGLAFERTLEMDGVLSVVYSISKADPQEGGYYQ